MKIDCICKQPNDKSIKRAKTAASAAKKSTSSGGKENNQYAKKKEGKNTKDVVKDMLAKNVVGEVKPNHEAKVLLTSPKVNRL